MKTGASTDAKGGGPIFRHEGANEAPKLVLLEVAVAAEAVPVRTRDRLITKLRESLSPVELDDAAQGLSNILGGGWHG